ncbi:MAG TPA: hypothetical protein VK324_16450, partial [Tepidisphaeraceae bacterium]|nr:hypothetical protein [Tepidisphaeraceae bacterium]
MFADLLAKDDYSRSRDRQLGNGNIRAGLLAVWFAFLVLGAVRLNPRVPPFWFALFVLAGGAVLLVAGCVRHATVKGYRPWVGVFAAAAGPVGVAVLRRLRDRTDVDESGRGFQVVRPMALSTTWVDENNIGR